MKRCWTTLVISKMKMKITQPLKHSLEELKLKGLTTPTPIVGRSKSAFSCWLFFFPYGTYHLNTSLHTLKKGLSLSKHVTQLGQGKWIMGLSGATEKDVLFGKFADLELLLLAILVLSNTEESTAKRWSHILTDTLWAPVFTWLSYTWRHILGLSIM